MIVYGAIVIEGLIFVSFVYSTIAMVQDLRQSLKDFQ